MLTILASVCLLPALAFGMAANAPLYLLAQPALSLPTRVAALLSTRESLMLAGGLLVVQMLLIAALLVNRARLRRMGSALRAGEARHAAMLRALPDLLFVFNRDGVYVDYSAQESSLLIVPPEAFLGRRVRDVMPPDLAERFERAFSEALVSREPIVTEYALDLPGGRHEFEARIVRCGEDKILSVVRDVTARKVSEVALRASDAALRASHVRNHALAGRLVVAQEEERQRIARDLHDDLSQRLAVLSIEVNRLSKMNVVDARAHVAVLSGWVSDIAEHVHDLSHELHPSRPETLGLVPALRAVCNEMSRQHGITVDLEDREIPCALASTVSLCAYRIVQEALHNVAKHSGATRASVEISGTPTALDIVVADRGRGFVPEAGLVGLGLVSMSERVKLLDGEFAIDSSPGDGTRLRVRLPLAARPAVVREPDQQRA